MSTKVNKAAIGAFVIGAIVLLVAGVLILGAGKFFIKENTYITYFTGSVKGLNVGSPVMFRGVKVGEVTNISITADQRSTTNRLKIPVLFTLEPAKFKGTKSEFQRDPKAIEQAVKLYGLRTQLQTLSFVTGQLMVALDFFPGQPAQYVRLNNEYPEVPSVPTPIEQLQKTLEALPYKEIINNLSSAMAGIDRLVNSIDMKKTSETVEGAVVDLQALINHLDSELDPLLKTINNTTGAAEASLKEANTTMAAARDTMVDARGNMKELVTSTKQTLDSATAALKQSEQTLQSYSADSHIQAQMSRTLRDLSATTRSLRNLSDYLERHPESLLRGKKGEP
jgi:paraquat-inducible protein B